MPTQALAINWNTESQPDLNAGDAIIIPCFQIADPASKDIGLPGEMTLAGIQKLSGIDTLARVIGSEKFSAGFKSTLYLPALGRDNRRTLFVGLGTLKYLEPYRLEQALVAGFRKLKGDMKRLVCCLPDLESVPTRSAIIALISAAHQYMYRSGESLKAGPVIEQILLHSHKKDLSLHDAEQLIEQAQAMALARSQTRDLVNMPPNTKRTSTLVDKAENLRALGIEVEVNRDRQWIEKEMPAFFTVARGSLDFDPPCWIKLHYKPQGDIKYRIGLVGKSVIFDTGGYQVKPDLSMATMKADMTGGATVLAVLEAVASLKLPHICVTCYLAATPNMISASAFVPDSIIASTVGKKIEIRHTDAEGRLTLIDAVSMAAREKPDVILTIATLTGAASRAVGMRAALMANDVQWRNRFAESARLACDPYQELDVVGEDYEAIRSKLDGADIKNTGNRKGRGAQSAAAFVFLGAPDDQPIVHLDIAGGDMTEDDKSTGIAVQATIQFLCDLSKN